MRLFKLLYLSAIVALGFCAIFSASSKASDDIEGMKIMSFNIRQGSADDKENSWRFRKDTLIAVIRENDPIALGVQEALLEQVDYIKAALTDYDTIGVGRDDGKNAGEFMAIFYKRDALELLDSGTFWLSETPEKPSKGWDARCKRVVTWGKFRCKKRVRYLFMRTRISIMSVRLRVKKALN